VRESTVIRCLPPDDINGAESMNFGLFFIFLLFKIFFVHFGCLFLFIYQREPVQEYGNKKKVVRQ
jgi:hypothetical protein